MTLTRKIKINRKAFTLVEVLIVVIVIGILAAAIMYASDEMVSSAQAARILADLETWKQAALAWYNDNVSIVNYKGMINVTNPHDDISPSAFREDYGLSGYGVVWAEDLMPYLNMSGLKVISNPSNNPPGGSSYPNDVDVRIRTGVVDGYGGR